MARPPTLVNTESRKNRRDFGLWTALGRPLLRTGPTPHWCHIPPALFHPGKGLWSQYESRNDVGKRAGASGSCARV